MNTPRQRTLAGFDSSDEQPQAAEDTTPSTPAGGPPTTLPKPVAPPAKPQPPADPAAQPTTLEGETVWVVDSHSLIFQVFHALPEMTGPRGQPVGAIYGFARDIAYLLEEKRPTYLFCAFDGPEKTFRHTIYDNYKVDRAAMPEDLRPQIPEIKRLLEALRVPVLQCASYEADDILATVARQVEELGGECLLVTGDKDCRQLITDKVQVYEIRKDNIFNAAQLEEVWGIRPDQVVDFQSLVGDPTDNVPGIPLIGPKIARQLLNDYDTLEGVLEHADELSGKKRKENLKNGREQAMLSRQLVKLHAEVPVELDYIAARVEHIDTHTVGELSREFGFGNLGDRLQALGGGPPKVEWQANYECVSTAEGLKTLAAEMAQQPRVSIDTETTHINARRAEIVGYSFCWEPGQAYYVPVRTPEGEPRIDPAEALEILRSMLTDAKVGKLGQNLKYDMIVLRGAGVELAGLDFDTMLASYLLDAGGRNHNLDRLAEHYLGHETIKISELIGKGKNQLCMDEVELDLITPYAAEDADVPMRLYPLLAARLKEEGLESLFHDVEVPLVEVLAEMEFNGIRIDCDLLAKLSAEYGERMERLESTIYELAGREFNIASPKQLSEILFEELGLPPGKKTKTGFSTDAEVLEDLAPQHPLPAKILDYRQYAKLKGTYLDALPELVNPATGRLHTSFNQVVAATGRLSSNDPNLQNIPIRTEEGREIRSAFLPGQDDWKLLTADYSQIELRVLAHYSGDETLLAAFASGEDIHTRVASEVYEVPLEEVDRSQRRSAKAINFGIIYGQSPFGLAKSLGIDQEKAAEFIEAYFVRYPGVDRFMNEVLANCREQGYVTTILGRRREIQGVRPAEKLERNRQRTMPERTAVNTVIQGSAADLIKLAMLGVYRRLRREALQSKLLLQIHDELVFEVPPTEIETLATLVREEMSGAYEMDVPLDVDIKTGANWAQCEPME